jgi:hypothetical protein
MSQLELTYQTCDLDHKTKITPLKKNMRPNSTRTNIESCNKKKTKLLKSG